MAKRVGVAEPDAVTLDGKSSPKLRRRSKQAITPEQQEIFFDALADSCNVDLSARRAGFSACWAYRKRRTDASFRHQWAAAVREGYAKLELMLLERAMKGTPRKVRISGGGGDEIIREYSNTLAIALLRRHAETVDGLDGLDDDDGNEELRAKIIAQLDLIRERDGGQSGHEIETKNASGRLALIRRMLAA